MAQNHEFELMHYWRSSCSWRLRWALSVKGLEFKSTPINLLKAEHKSPSYLKLNPSGAVPTLLVDGQPFSESVAIIEWLEEEYPTHQLLPTSSKDKLIVRQMAYVIASGTQPLQNLAAQKYYSEDPDERLKYSQHWIKRGLESFEAYCNQHSGSFSFGSQVTLADLCLIPQCYNAARFGVELEKYPNIDQIYQRCLEDQHCNESAPHNQPGAN